MDLLTGFEKTQDTISRAVSVAQNKKEFLGKQAVNVLLLIIILAVFGCLDFATLKFHPEYLINLNYWIMVGSKAIAGICAFNIGINLLWEIELKRDTILGKAIELYEKVIQYKKLDFEYYINRVFNVEEKKKAYISQINAKIHRLNKWSRAKDRLLYSTEIPKGAENYEQLVEELNEKKSHNRYCIRRLELEKLKDEEFINKNIDSLKVRYDEVDSSVFELEIDGSSTYRGVKVKGNVQSARIKATSSMVLGMVAFSMFITAIGLEINQEELADQMKSWLDYLIKCVTDVGIVLWQCIRGMAQVRKMISSEYTRPYTTRCNILLKYYSWKAENDKESTEWCNKVIAMFSENPMEIAEIELTEDEIKKLKQTNE